MTVRLVVDTDGGVDDAVALWWALTAPDVEVVAITVVHGNVPMAVAAANVARVIEAAGCDGIPVALGAEVPMGPTPDLRPADFIHGTDGLGETHRPPPSMAPVDRRAVGVLHDHVGGEVVLVTLGPLTNVARAVLADPAWAVTAAGPFVMGGTVIGAGNAQPFAEANIAHDPTAAAIVAAAPWATPPVLVGLDVTHRATFRTDEFELLAERRSPAAAFLDEPLAFYRRHGGTFCAPGECPCHDLLAVMAAARPGLVTGPVLPLAVQTEPGPAWGATIVDRRVPFFERAGSASLQACPPGFGNWTVGLEVDVDRFRAEVRRLFGEA